MSLNASKVAAALRQRCPGRTAAAALRALGLDADLRLARRQRRRQHDAAKAMRVDIENLLSELISTKVGRAHPRGA